MYPFPKEEDCQVMVKGMLTVLANLRLKSNLP